MTYEECLKALVDADERFLVLTAENRAAIRNLPQQIGKRFIDVGICEQTMIGAAAGLALRGRIPIVHALASFLTLRAFEFIRTDVGIAKLPVKLVGSFSGLISEANGPTHQAIEDVALMRGIPNINVWCPADNEDMLIGLETILRDPAPYYIRYNNLAPKTSHNLAFRPGVAEIFAEGADVTILTYGLMFSHCYTACEMLCEADVSTGLVNLRTLKPLDTAALNNVARQSRLLVTVEDHFKIGGLFSMVCEHLIEAGIRVPVLSIAFDGQWFKPGLMDDVLQYESLTPIALKNRIIDRLSALNS
jgi:transketolase